MPAYRLRSLTLSLLTFCLILLVSGVLIVYGRGYRINITDRDVKTTGLIAATSDPTGAQVLINGKLRTATNQTINLDPDWYDVTIVKEGYTKWQKHLRVQGEVVSRADAFLIPTNPSLSTLSTAGVVAPTLSPDGSKIAYIVPPDPQATVSSDLVDKAGVWIYDLTDRPLGLNRDQRQIMKTPKTDLTGSVLAWSPDSKSVLITTPENSPLLSYYMLDESKLNDPPRPVVNLEETLKGWEIIEAQKHTEKLVAIPRELIPIASSSMNMITFSPDEDKILYVATASATLPLVISPPLVGTNSTTEVRTIEPNNLYVYDLKEDKNYLLGDTKTFKPFPAPTPKVYEEKQTMTQARTALLIAEKLRDATVTYVQWLPTSRHLILVSPDKIEIMEFDGANRTTAYSGPFGESFVAPWSDASKLVIITNLNQTTAKRYNLYTINLR